MWTFTWICIDRYDAVTYLKYLDSLRASESFRSVWIFSESSHKIFEYAKKRVYHFGRSDGGKSLVPSKTLSTKKRKLEKNKSEDGKFPFSFYTGNFSCISLDVLCFPIDFVGNAFRGLSCLSFSHEMKLNLLKLCSLLVLCMKKHSRERRYIKHFVFFFMRTIILSFYYFMWICRFLCKGK